MINRPLLSLPLSILNKIGLLLTNDSGGIHILISIIVPSTSLLVNTILMIIILLYMEKTVIHYVQSLEGIIAFIQVLGKIFLCSFIKDKYLKLIQLTNEFRKAEESLTGTELENISRLLNTMLLLQKLFYSLIIVFVVFSTCVLFFIKELFTGVWIWEKNMYFWCVWVKIAIDVAWSACFTAGNEGLFLGFCCEDIIQCKILQYNFESLSVNAINSDLDYEKYYQKWRSCIKHHILLLRFHSQLQDVYSGTLLIQYITGAPLICIEAYALVADDFSIGVLIRYGVCIIVVGVLVAFYCLPIGFVDTEMSLIANSIYNSDWNSNHFLSLRASTVIPIQMAQRKIAITACGLIEFNAVTLVQIFKLAFSTCVALKNIREM